MSVKPVSFSDKILPSQPVFIEQFEGGEERFYPVLQEALMRFSNLRLPTEEFILQRSEQVTIEEMASSPTVLRFLQLLITLKQPRRILEIGAFIGLSAMSMAKALPEGGQVVTIEKYDHFAALAQENFRRNGLAEKIRLIQGDAFAVLDSLKTERFDMAFIDGNKERYREYFEMIDPLLSPGALVVVDDVLFHGDALNARPKTEKGAGVRRFLEAAEARADYQKVLLPFSNGLMLMVKRA